MNTLDRMIAAVSPQRAVKRAAARRKLEILDSGYSNYGASQTKKSMLGWLYGGGSAKEDIQENQMCLRDRFRGSEAVLAATEEACRVAVRVMREYLEKKGGEPT